MSEDYQQAVIDKVISIEQEQNIERRKFLAGVRKHIIPNNYEVVYAIVAKWHDRDFVDALPFFSKVNLRWHTENLHRMGYRVSIKKVNVV